MTQTNIISPNKKLKITFGEMSEQAMGGAYYCPIYLKNENEEPFLLHERNIGNALWQGNSKIYFPIWVRNPEGHLKQKIAFFDIKRSKIGIFDRFFEVIELKSIKGDLIEAIDSPNWHPKNIVFDVKNEAVSETFSWTKIDAEIVAIKSRMNLTKGGNWYAFPEGRDPIKGYRFIFTNVEHIDDVHNQNQDKFIFYSGETEADIDFIAHARQDIPILLKEIELLKTDKYGADFPILDTDLHAIKARYEATSIAPWVSFIEGRDLEAGSSFIMTGIKKGDYIWDEKRGEDIEFSGTPADLDFIAHARQDIPILIAEIERLKKL
jgi:hypothetical protein